MTRGSQRALRLASILLAAPWSGPAATDGAVSAQAGAAEYSASEPRAGARGHEDLAPLIRDARLEAALTTRDVTGVMVIFDAQAGTWITNDPSRAHVGYLPASTFKIPNSLIALEVGAVTNADEVLKWDGVDRGSAHWNADQSLRQAYDRSTVWLYQECARRTGEERMRDGLERCGYGNRQLGAAVDQFWLTGSLRITPVQQIEFLRRLQAKSLPFREDVMTTVLEIMIRDRRDDWILRAKTGWLREPVPPVGWDVGWLERAGKHWFFATELDLRKKGDDRKRLTVTYANLVAIGALPAGTEPPGGR